MKNNTIHYQGESNGVHSWSSAKGASYYWHQSWLHIAEDEMGVNAHSDLALNDNHGLTLDDVAEKVADYAEQKEK
ncbi:hypothetical protein [Vibrio sp. 99-8-1]|uniref:hypothetical protein n=1 Tax=Vibrio sp. 99-8-1 TaxID=2607602 RepID=UPI0014933399|nr:hypothetical protein [Vibrio sp. 99-8-1]NOI65766.1 hypothetical protein [Vibrio sp. 99-8-1]